jgi:hypothetical protein
MAYLLRIEEGGMLVPALWLLVADAVNEDLAVLVAVLKDSVHLIASSSTNIPECCDDLAHG